MTIPCPLCFSDSCVLFVQDERREYWQCTKCGLIHVPPRYHLSSDQERSRYALHNNHPDNTSYLEYLEHYVQLVQRLPMTNPRILDFGCGEHAVLTSLFQQRGFDCVGHDPLYGIKKPDGAFDIVLMGEVFEHFRQPGKELERIRGILSKGGYAVIRTRMYPSEKESFSKWWYKEDSTHISFANQDSIKHVGRVLGAKIQHVSSVDTFVCGPK